MKAGGSIAQFYVLKNLLTKILMDKKFTDQLAKQVGAVISAETRKQIIRATTGSQVPSAIIPNMLGRPIKGQNITYTYSPAKQ